jgi:hypothetical protein
MFVVTEFIKGSSSKRYLGHMLEVEGKELNIKFLRCRSKKFFYFPVVCQEKPVLNMKKQFVFIPARL